MAKWVGVPPCEHETLHMTNSPLCAVCWIARDEEKSLRYAILDAFEDEHGLSGFVLEIQTHADKTREDIQILWRNGESEWLTHSLIANEYLPFSEPVNDTDYAGDAMYAETGETVAKAS